MKRKTLYCWLPVVFPLLFGGLVLIFSSPFPVDAEPAGQQEHIVKGRVVAAGGEEGLPGVNITVKGNPSGTVTDPEGYYTIEVPGNNAVLIVSFLGFSTREIPVQGRSQINITLSPDVQALEEVVVVGYGTQVKRNVTGSISTVDAVEMKDMPVGQIGQKLQGKFAGVQVNQTTGTPGRGISFRIRGQASINAGNSPLFVVDGFPISGGIERISPEEIETFTVLKDASAASLYGSRAANGVILITTKSAKKGQSRIEFSSYFGTQIVPERGRPDLMNAREFAQYKKEWYEDAAIYQGYTGGVPEQYQHPEEYGPDDGTNWFDVLLRDAPTQNYNLSLSTGSDRFQSAVNVNYNRQEGVMLNTFAERFSARANNTYQASDRLTFGLNLSGAYQLSQNFATDGYWQIISAAYLLDPGLEYRNEDGTYPVAFSSPGMFPNPNWYRVLTEKINPLKQTSALANAYAELNILDGLTFKTTLNADIGNNVSRSFTPSTAGGAMFIAPPQPPSGSYGTSNYLTWLSENTLTYTKTLKDHHFDALVGYSAQKYSGENSSINATNFPDDEIDWINAAVTRIGTAGISEWSMLSLIGRLNYNFREKYLVSLALRRDGSSRFGSNRKWGTFPSVSAGWIISDEPFLKSSPRVSYLKIRASYGLTGNNNIGDYRFLAGVSDANYVVGDQVASGKVLNALGNDNLSWEKTAQFDAGLDLGLWGNRVLLTYDYYRKTTDGLLYAIDVPYASGYGSVQSNIGEFQFWGHEFGVQTQNTTGALDWSTSLNITLNRNLVKKLGTNNTPIGGYQENVDYVRTEVGHPMGQFYGYIYDRVFMTQEEFENGAKSVSSEIGSVRIRDVSGPEGVPDGIIDVNDKTFIGNPIPDFLFGITNQFYYKDFDLSIHLTGSVGGDLMDVSYQWTENLDGVFNVRKEVAQRWRSPENPGEGNIPRTSSDPLHRYNNSRWIWNGSYLTVKNITLGYTLPVTANKFIKKARIYLSAQNAFIITSYPGMNPEVSDSGLSGLREGVDQASYPVPRILTGGINVSF